MLPAPREPTRTGSHRLRIRRFIGTTAQALRVHNHLVTRIRSFQLREPALGTVDIMTQTEPADAAFMAKTITSDPAFKGILPSHFLYGCSSASHQIEGGYLSDGKGMGIWDEYLEKQENGQVACDSYHMWRDDIRLLKMYGCTTYRFSIAWSRVKPKGRPDIDRVKSFLSGD